MPAQRALQPLSAGTGGEDPFQRPGGLPHGAGADAERCAFQIVRLVGGPAEIIVGERRAERRRTCRKLPSEQGEQLGHGVAADAAADVVKLVKVEQRPDGLRRAPSAKTGGAHLGDGAGGSAIGFEALE